jgi:hypothetical protein
MNVSDLKILCTRMLSKSISRAEQKRNSLPQKKKKKKKKKKEKKMFVH